MFGFVVANRDALTQEQLIRYRSAYCGLCRALGERHGAVCRLALTYDMTFLTLLLGSLYEPEETGGEGRCVVHPLKSRAWRRDEFTDYAADMSVVLAYAKCRDDWADDGSLAGRAGARALRHAYMRIYARYPVLCGEVERCLCRLQELEAAQSTVPDACAGCFGMLMAAVFSCRDDIWAPYLCRLGEALGRAVYIMDACVDLPRDEKRCRFNAMRGVPEEEFEEILSMLLGDAAAEFEKLPLVRDAGLLRNILYSGIWTQYNLKYQKERTAPQDHDTGPL